MVHFLYSLSASLCLSFDSWQSRSVFASGSVHEEIIQWWNKASVQKPLKCTINPSYLTPLHNIAMKLLENAVWKPIFYTENCSLNDAKEHPYVYKGKKMIFLQPHQISEANSRECH